MAKSSKASPENGKGPPGPGDRRALENWLARQPREWSVTIAARAALRSLPLVHGTEEFSDVTLSVFRASAIVRFAAKYPNRKFESSIAAAASAAAADKMHAAPALAAAHAAYAATAATAATATVFATAGSAAALYLAVNQDMQRLHERALTANQLARDQLWPIPAPAEFSEAWQKLRLELQSLGHHWQIWIDWYENIALCEPHRRIAETKDAAYTDIPGILPWDDGAEAVNTEIARRLSELSRGAESYKVPDQSPAPVRVEERNQKVAKATDRDSALSTAERDFSAWRDPVLGHAQELAASDFAAGTNHSRIRERLMALGKLLPGEIAEVKDRQFSIGYEIERFEGLIAAYRSGGEDMPKLNAAQLEDLDRLRIALKMGIDKLERWSEFRKAANESTEGDADRETVSNALDEMAGVMEQRPRYFDPQLPATFRFLAEAVRDPSGATKTVVYGAVKSAENLVSFLGQRALGIGTKGMDAIESHISKAVATALIASIGGAALGLSAALPQGWVWLKPLLNALGVAGG